MSHYPLWAYRQQLEHQFASELNSPYTDHQRVKEIKTAIDEKVQDLRREQLQGERSNIEKLKGLM